MVHGIRHDELDLGPIDGCMRCGAKVDCMTMSYFNLEMICTKCEDAEKAHPAFERARNTETAECKAGNYNFEGIGLPPELVGGGHV